MKKYIYVYNPVACKPSSARDAEDAAGDRDGLSVKKLYAHAAIVAKSPENTGQLGDKKLRTLSKISYGVLPVENRILSVESVRALPDKRQFRFSETAQRTFHCLFGLASQAWKT